MFCVLFYTSEERFIFDHEDEKAGNASDVPGQRLKQQHSVNVKCTFQYRIKDLK